GVAQNLLHELHDRRESAERDHNQSPKADGKPQALRVYFAMELGDTATKLATKLADSATELGLKPLLRGQQIGLSGKLCHDEISGCLCVRLGVVLGHAAFAQPSRISQTVETVDHPATPLNNRALAYQNKTRTQRQEDFLAARSVE